MVYNYTKPRGPIAAMYSSPGPCYALPGLVGQPNHDIRSVHSKGPAYIFGIKHGKTKDDCSPGPCHLPTHKIYRDGADGTPHYSLYSRPQDVKSFRTPGPGAYSPEAAGPSTHFHHPQYSFGSRHRNRRTDSIPAPNNYTLPTMTGKTHQSGKRQAPCYSLTGRSKTGSFHEDLQKTPGPGTYNTTAPSVNKERAPLYSMTSRNVMPGDSTQKPGPGAHSPEKFFPHKRTNPKFSFGIRHSEYIAPLIVDPVE
ncbi:outer dense fiber protein 3 [Lingula anatina]|uniref:Outer dense fiber protein 3 n=1 Tax=Lingula anatina TaxID=7574 RepID=A0A1S3IB09_LINAN|nr:outer dense fiber protein 3 [Lingula anatina]|eukprot:XP_013395447.1 outer dense fiber protein 3 [Lingula anatina]